MQLFDNDFNFFKTNGTIYRNVSILFKYNKIFLQELYR